MNASVDASSSAGAPESSAHSRAQILALGDRVLGGGELCRDEALWLLELSQCGDIFDLLSCANRVREHFKGNRVHLCSSVNVKAGGCPENCRFCAQSALYQTDAPRYGLVDGAAVGQALQEAEGNGVAALGLVAAWRGLEEGPVLDELCRQFEAMSRGGKVRTDASLGIIRNQAVADRLKRAGVACYNHNLETSRAFFSQVCTTHSYDERLATLKYLQRAGIKICSGGILGLGESRADRRDLAFALKEVGAEFIPINVLNPIPGTPFAANEPLPPLEILKTIACFRLVLPTQEIMVAGGRTVNLRDLQSLIFAAGASALMVGNYLTTLNQPVEKDLQMLKDLGLVPVSYHPAGIESAQPFLDSPAESPSIRTLAKNG